MSTLSDPQVQALLEKPNYATISTLNKDGSMHSTVIWISGENGMVAVNSAVGRLWPTNLQRDPHTAIVVQENGNPYHFVEIRGTVTETAEGPEADEHIDALAKKYIDEDKYPYRGPDERRIKFTIAPEHVRFVKQG
jgi:PPOX class probable F420-dependent enzyme